MKIAIPADEKTLDSTVCQSFGRTPYFLIYDIEAESADFIDNSAASSQGGAGIKAAQSIVDSKVSAILTPRCGQNAAEVLTAAGILIYKTESSSIKESIAAFKEKRLEQLQEIHAGFHGHGG
ncbi:MAG: NifB/NifX family molybdenum-iron cluster-binding protein [Synergistaceae bacterium]|jgi:predicted Fe-Mo cluster-binding NifX family protein|nr:NifB/NifX family molybdenum-iron cluster-binding protein [Synergistaceae bacterium]